MVRVSSVLAFLALLCCAFAKPATRITNGTVAELGEFPWMAELLSSSTNSHKCGASIIGDRWILTAAHCIGSGQEIVLIGDLMPGKGVRYESANVMVHPNFTLPEAQSDVAVIELTENIEMEQGVIEKVRVGSGTPDYNIPCTLSGWGGNDGIGNNPYEDGLLRADFQAVPDEACVAWLRIAQAVYPEDALNQFEASVNLCIFSRHSASFFGDSGGPLVCGPNREQYGVTSWGVFDDAAHYARYNPPVFAEASSDALRPWINENCGGCLDES